MFEQSATKQVYQAATLPIALVTVFNDRAEVKRRLKTLLKVGINEVVVENITKFADESSIQVDLRGKAILHEVQYQRKACIPTDLQSPRIKALNDEKKALDLKKEVLVDETTVLEKQLETLDGMIKQSGKSVVKIPEETQQSFELTDENLRDLTDFYDRYAKVSCEKRQRLRITTLEIDELNKKIGILNAEISQAQSLSNFSRNANLLLEGFEEGEVELDISYQVWHAQWYPCYDIRVSSDEDGHDLMKINYFGVINQNTGEDWFDAQLILSTAHPSIGGNVPELGTSYAEFYKPPLPGMGYSRCRAMPQCAAFGMSTGSGGVTNSYSVSEDKEMSIAEATVEAGVLSTTFTIPRSTTILSDSGEHKVTITVLELEPILIHEAVPCKNSNVYVAASAVNSSSFPLLAGETSVYFGNSFVAKASIKAVAPGEQFSCSLGIDPAISIDYKPAHKFSERVGYMSKSASDSNEQKIVIKNTKQTKVLLTIKEFIPKSTDAKIKVRLYSPELNLKPVNETPMICVLPTVGARLDKSHNLEWTVSLEPNCETELLIKWVIEYPSSMTVEFCEI